MDVKKGLPVYALALCILAAGTLIALSLRAGAAPSYRQEKVREISDMVLRREVVPEDYLRYVDEDLAEALRTYNQETSSLKMSYAREGVAVAEALFFENEPAPGPYQRPERFYQLADHISSLALYQNYNQLIQTDSVAFYPLWREEGGSGGLWGWALHEDFYAEEDVLRSTEEYFVLVDGLLDKLERGM